MKDKMIAYIWNEIETYKSKLDIVESLPELGDLDIRSFVITNSGIGLFIPYDLALLSVIRKRLGRAWRFKHSWLDAGSGKLMLVYAEDSGRSDLSVHLEPLTDGATCRRVQTGTREVPVYAVRCK